MSFDNIKHTERSPVRISLFYYETIYLLSTYDHRDPPTTPFNRTCRHFCRYVNKLVGSDMTNVWLEYLDKIVQICGRSTISEDPERLRWRIWQMCYIDTSTTAAAAATFM